MPRIHALAAALAAGLLALPAAEAPAADILDACAPEIENICGDVEPGHGRIAACLYAHEDQVSDTCDAAMADTADAIDLFFDRLQQLKSACGEDIRAQCSGLAPGEGRILSCLAENSASLSETCGELMSTVNLPQDG
ncbi:MAG: cysteine rich repeat-containing protein [Pseudomonadota bacterium]